MTSGIAADPPFRVRKPSTISRLRDPQVWRLGSGLVLFIFALTHFLNHALGHVSLEAMEAVQTVRSGLWRSTAGGFLLYGALIVHAGLALGKLASRRTWRIPHWQAAQIGLGLLVAVLGAGHVAATRGAASAIGYDDSYHNELRLLWPGRGAAQSVFLAIVWLHATIGLHHWLRTYPWYRRWSPALLVLAVLVPTLAITGWIEAGRRVAQMSFPEAPLSDAQLAVRSLLIDRADKVVWGAFGVTLAAIAISRFLERVRSGPAVTYSGGRTVRTTKGATLLEISRTAGVPHAAVCGGRGRCTTCRVAVLEGIEGLAPPGPTEAAALARIDAPEGVRLACQVRPTEALKVRPLIPLREAEPTAGRDAYRWGVERRITVMFADLRGFTTLTEKLYPYDSVFLLNRYFEVMSEAIERNGGEVDKFLGDGIMALFGVSPARGSGSRDALLAGRDMLAALERLNREFDATLSDRLRMGLGIHMGPAVLGRVGGGRHAGLTALGDSVNIASRLEALNKEFGSTVIVSEATLTAARLALPQAALHEVPVRGREEPLRIAVAQSLADLAILEETEA